MGERAIGENHALKSVRLPSGIKELANRLCMGNAAPAMVIPDGVTRIGSGCFADSLLEEILIPASVTNFATDAFVDCARLTALYTTKGSPAERFFGIHLPRVNILYTDELLNPALVLPSAMKELDEEAFAGAGVTTVKCPQGMTAIGKRAFADCSSLKWIIIPASVNSISDDAFANCSGFVIYGVDGSFASEYAEDHGILFRTPLVQW